MAKGPAFEKYQTLFMIPEVDENGNEIKTENACGQMRRHYIDAPTFDIIPDWGHRNVTDMIYTHLSGSGQVKFADIQKEVGSMFRHMRLDYIKKYLENYSKLNDPQFQLIAVNNRYWTHGKGSMESMTDADMTIAESYIAKTTKAVGWVASGEGYDGAEVLTKARWVWQAEKGEAMTRHADRAYQAGSGLPDGTKLRAIEKPKAKQIGGA